MRDATHGAWCGAVTWPTKCPHCGAAVYFFKCNCGSKVFFDSLGGSWPSHDCDLSWGRSLERRRDESGGVIVEVSPGVTAYRSGSISPGVVTTARRRVSKPGPIVRVRPEDVVSTKVVVMGIVRELQTTLDVMPSLKLPASAVTAALLGPLGKGRWGKVTIHASEDDDKLLSYTAWARREALTRVKHSTGITVAVTLQAQAVPGKERVWVCKHYEVMMG